MAATRSGCIRWRVLAAVAITTAALALPTAMHAQSLTEGSLRGDIVLGDGTTPITGASLTLEDETGVVIHQFKSDLKGRFLVPLVSPGRYSMLVEKTGYQPTRQRGIDVVADVATRVWIRVARRPPPIMKVEEIVVADQRLSSSSPRFAELASRPWSDWFAPRPDLSDDGRNSALVAAPRDHRSGFATSFGGLPQSYSRLLIDGLPGDWFRQPALETEPAGTPPFPRFLFRQVQVVPHATDVELTGGNGGMLMAVSRRGTSRFRFEPFAFWSGGLGIPSADNAGDSSVTSIMAGATVSGTVVPGKATYTAGFSYETLETPNARPWESDSTSVGGAAVPLVSSLETIAQDSFNQAVRGFTRAPIRTYRGGTGGVRLDWRLSPKHSLMVRSDLARHREWNPALGVDLFNDGGSHLDARDFSGEVALASGWDNGANEFRVGYRSTERDWRAARLPATYLVGDGVAIGASPALPGDFSRTAFAFSETFQVNIGPSKQGRVKVGAQYSNGHWEQEYNYGSDGIFSFGDLDAFSRDRGAFFVAQAPSNRTRFTVREYGVFGQLIWRFSPAFSGLAGLRYGREKFPQQSNLIAPNPFFLSTFGIRNSRVPDDNHDIAPRLGLTWEGGPKQEWTASLGASRQFGTLNPARLAEAAVADGPLRARREVGGLGPWPALPDSNVAPSSGQIITLFSPIKGEYKNPRTTKFDAMLGRTLISPTGAATRVTISAGYHHTDYLLRRTDLNLLPGPTGTTQEGRDVFGTLAQEGGLVVASPGSNRRFGGFDLVSALASTGFSNHYEVALGFSREAVAGLSFSASYVWSQTRDNWLQSWTGDPTDELSPFPLDRPGQEWAEGVSDYDIPHRAAALATWSTKGRVPIRLGARYRFRSGLPFTPGFRPGVDANGDGSARNDPAFLDNAVPGLSQVIGEHACLKDQVGKFAERNSCRESANHALDLNASVGLPLHSLGGRLELMVDVFNLVSSATGVIDRALLLVDPAGTLTTDPQGNVTLPLLANPRFGKLLSRRTDPRMVRFGLRLGY